MKLHYSTTQITTMAGVLLLALLTSSHASLYQLDDGTAEDSVGITGGNGADLIALNQFNVIGGNNMIGSVSIAWGTPFYPDSSLNGLNYTVAIWADPNNDGNPSDAVLLATAPDVISNEGTDTFITTLFPCVQVTRSFFVGFIVTQNGSQFPAAFDESAPLTGRSFIAGSSTPGGGDISNLMSPNNDLPLNDVQNYGLNGNWMIRADACVPEPSTAALGLVGGLMGAAVWRKRIARLLSRQRRVQGVGPNLGGSIFVCSYGKAARRRLQRSTSELPSRRSFASRPPQVHLKHPA
jgi:hypothetical protein